MINWRTCQKYTCGAKVSTKNPVRDPPPRPIGSYNAFMQHLWFKAKNYGWGWTPAAWQGWAVLLVYIGGVAGSAFVFLHDRPTTTSWILYACTLAIASALLVAVCLKTGEKPGWHWGEKNR